MLLVCSLMATPVMSASADVRGFSDVPASHPFGAEIEWLETSGATTGFPDDTFRPVVSVTRQAWVAWLWRLAGAPTPIGPNPFPDVAADHPFVDAITWSAESGLAEGFADGTFRPAADITRQAVIALLWRLAGEPDPPGPPPFFDTPPGHPFADAIAWAYVVDLTDPYDDGTFRPTRALTRQAGAAFLFRSDGLGLLG